MTEEIKIFLKHTCQFCGCERKLVEILIDDEFVWNEIEKIYQPNGFTDTFEHRGVAHTVPIVKKNGLDYDVFHISN